MKLGTVLLIAEGALPMAGAATAAAGGPEMMVGTWIFAAGSVGALAASILQIFATRKEIESQRQANDQRFADLQKQYSELRAEFASHQTESQKGRAELADKIDAKTGEIIAILSNTGAIGSR